MIVVFRTDSSRLIGSGHIMRCMSLADEFVRHGAAVIFICRDLPGNWTKLLTCRGFATWILGNPVTDESNKNYPDNGYAEWLGVDQITDAEETLNLLGNLKPDWLVVDHYALDSTWEGLLRKGASNILAIDDVANRSHDCDMLLDQTYAPETADRYHGLVQSRARQLLGPTFALLRSEFRMARKSLRSKTGRINRALVSFGGLDTGGETLKVLDGLVTLERTEIFADVVVGMGNPFFKEISDVLSRNHNMKLHCPANSMSDLMSKADLSFGAGGMTAWERCCLGLASIVKPIAENQKAAMTALMEIGAIELIPISRQTTPMDYLVAFHRIDPSRLLEMSRIGFELVDGLGCNRVVKRVLDYSRCL